MKYKRLTKRISDGEEAFLFHSSLHEAIERLAKLEDKIERGELISVLQEEQNEREIEFFCKHNDYVRHTILLQFFEDLRKKEQSIKMGTEWIAVISDKEIEVLLKKRYGVELFGNKEN